MTQDGSQSSGRRGRRFALGALGGVVLVAIAIALGVVYSGHGGRSSEAGPATKDAFTPAAADTNNVAKVLDALNALNGGATTESSTNAGAATAVVVPDSAASKDATGMTFTDTSSMAGGTGRGALAPASPVGVLQTMAANTATMMGMHVCTPKDGPELVGCLCYVASYEWMARACWRVLGVVGAAAAPVPVRKCPETLTRRRPLHTLPPTHKHDRRPW